jgi:hypothetical protein
MNNPSIGFHPLFPTWGILLLTVPLLYFVWKEYTRPHKFLILRLAAMTLAILSILGAILRPFYHEDKTASLILVLTEGYARDKADSIVKSNPEIKICRSNHAEPYPLSTVSSFNSLDRSAIRFVIGAGLPPEMLDRMDENKFTFIAGTAPEGITEVRVANRIRVNQRNLIQGTINTRNKTVIRLLSPGGVEDSVIVGSGTSSFALSFKPKQPGLYLCTMDTRGTDGKRSSESLPVEVVNEQKLRILILQEFPAAEVRYLKNHLAEKGHAIALRYQISKSRFGNEYANLAPLRTDHLTKELLDAFDLVMADDKILQRLNGTEADILESSVRNGLGLIITFVGTPEKGKTVNRYIPLVAGRVNSDTVHVRLSGAKRFTIPAVPIDLAEDPAIHPIIRTGKRLLSGYYYSGAGKVGFQLLRETYRLVLEGSSDDYSFVWTPLLEMTSRTKWENFNISITRPIPYFPDEPVAVEVISSGLHPVLRCDSVRLPLTEDALIDDRWTGKLWAGKPGWHQFTFDKDSTHLNYFVSKPGSWNALELMNRKKANQAFNSSVAVQPATKETEEKEISALWFYLIFLLSSGFLWLAPKL